MYRHAVEGQLAVDLKLVGWGRPSTGVHQRVAELERKQEADFRFYCCYCQCAAFTLQTKATKVPTRKNILC